MTQFFISVSGPLISNRNDSELKRGLKHFKVRFFELKNSIFSLQNCRRKHAAKRSCDLLVWRQSTWLAAKHGGKQEKTFEERTTILCGQSTQRWKLYQYAIYARESPRISSLQSLVLGLDGLIKLFRRHRVDFGESVGKFASLCSAYFEQSFFTNSLTSLLPRMEGFKMKKNLIPGSFPTRDTILPESPQVLSEQVRHFFAHQVS